MTNSEIEAAALIDKYLAGDCSTEELRTIENAYHNTALKKNFADRPVDFEHIGRESWKHIYVTINRKQVVRRKLWSSIYIAASVLLIAAIGIWFSISRSTNSKKEAEIAYKNDVGPGKNSAILKLANGKTIKLSETKAGVVIQAEKLTYSDGSGLSPISGQLAQSGSITTPKGGQYQITLPDGTKVWLNSASTLSFSLSHEKSSDRNVELFGEAYFEVAKDKLHAFVVRTKGQEVKVLGTHFNINGYADDNSIKTTLLEGSVKVSTGSHFKIIKPGEQAVLLGHQIEVLPANIKETIAWKNGYFYFREQKIDRIMLQLSRWYDIDVKYDGAMPQERFNGNISRYTNISEVLNMLSYAKAVKFKVEGRRVTVMQ